MADANFEELLTEVGQLLAEDSEYPLEDTLLHAIVHRAFVSPSIYKNLDDHILNRDPDLDRLGDALLDLWEAQEGDERWEEIHYVVRSGRFEAIFVYPEEIDADEEPIDRRERIVPQYFGNKPIIYPPDHEDDGFDL